MLTLNGTSWFRNYSPNRRKKMLTMLLQFLLHSFFTIVIKLYRYLLHPLIAGRDNYVPNIINTPELMPKHVAVIMDGNRRWARNRGLPVQLGHSSGGRAMKQLVLNCSKYGVQVLTVFAFSTENWSRPKEEVEFLMDLIKEITQTDIEELMRNDVRVSFMGNKSRIPESLQELVHSAQERSKDNTGLHLVIAVDYSGRYDITQAAKKIARKAKDGLLQVDDIDDSLFEQHLETNGVEFANPDLMIRTSGELRVSNFMLWQLAYTELLFVDKLFPDFDETDLVEALSAFQKRQRRYGGHKY